MKGIKQLMTFILLFGFICILNIMNIYADDTIVDIDERLLYGKEASETYLPESSLESNLSKLKYNYNNDISKDLAYYIAKETLLDIGEELKDEIWRDSDLSEPFLVKSIQGEDKYYIFQIVYSGISVGEIVSAATMSEAPIMYISYKDYIYSELKEGGEIAYIKNNGFAKKIDNTWYYYGTKNEATLKEIDINEENEVLIKRQWEGTIEALFNNSSLLFDSINENSKSLPTSVNISTVQDFTWHLVCGATTGAMVADWYGRYKDPQLLLNSRPHSNQISSVLYSSTYFGGSTNYNKWITKYKQFLQNNSSCSVTVTGVDHGSNSATWTAYKNHIGTTKEPDVIGTIHGNNAHAMAAIGYIGNYYITRDTWTDDGTMTNTTYIYNNTSYSYSCVLITFGSSTWRASDIQMGSSGVNVKRLETLLYNLYYNPGTIDNTFTTTTENAVKAFQADFGLYVDGVVGQNTYAALVSAHRFSMQSRVLSQGCQGDDVAELQRRLNRFKNHKPGYSSLPTVAEDGDFGSYTKAAVIAFQQITGLYVDGIVGSYTYSALIN